ncbi:TadA family conjugal transfer-associated ATPase [Nocardioides sp. Bht2]|uniref:TadA family conjugal transfer-associated ATPase n=1 Tax=Nocardioides sp. Bht2 TaxID=3392297 RepID=UPI0039B3D7CB
MVVRREPTVESGSAIELAARVRDRLAHAGGRITPQMVAEALRESGTVVGDAAVLEVLRILRAEALGAGVLDPLLREAGVTDVLVNGADAVWVDRGRGLEREGLRFADEAAVRRLAQRLAALGGRRLDDAAPHVDVRLPDGTRCHAVLFPVARPGTAISLRVPRAAGWSLAELSQGGTFSAEGAALLARIVAARAAFLVSGGTGVGKTALLSALLARVAAQERIVVVEDSGELAPRHPHVVALEARTTNVEGGGEISLRQLVRQALRMRPDRLVIGEVRGVEVVDLLAALNTGHQGGCGTVHANSAAAVPTRLEALAMPAGISRAALHSQVSSALDVVIHLGRTRTGERRLQEIAVLRRDTEGLVATVPAVSFTDAGELVEERGVAALIELLGPSV